MGGQIPFVIVGCVGVSGCGLGMKGSKAEMRGNPAK